MTTDGGRPPQAVLLRCPRYTGNDRTGATGSNATAATAVKLSRRSRPSGPTYPTAKPGNGAGTAPPRTALNPPKPRPPSQLQKRDKDIEINRRRDRRGIRSALGW